MKRDLEIAKTSQHEQLLSMNKAKKRKCEVKMIVERCNTQLKQSMLFGFGFVFGETKLG